MPPLRKACWEITLMTSQGIPGLPAALANQRACSCHVTSIVRGPETSNVVRPTMAHTEYFIQLVDMHRSTPCITPLGLESDNKRLHTSSPIIAVSISDYVLTSSCTRICTYCSSFDSDIMKLRIDNIYSRKLMCQTQLEKQCRKFKHWLNI